jgi:hypothetical protein
MEPILPENEFFNEYLSRPLEDYEKYLLDMYFPTPEIMSELLDNFAQMG